MLKNVISKETQMVVFFFLADYCQQNCFKKKYFKVKKQHLENFQEIDFQETFCTVYTHFMTIFLNENSQSSPA